MQGECVEFVRVFVFAGCVCCVGAGAELGDAGAAGGVYGDWCWWGAGRGVEGEELFVQCVEGGELGLKGLGV